MITPCTNRPNPHGFLNLPVVTEWQTIDADAVIFGAPYGKPYSPTEFPNDQSLAPSALRAASERILLHGQSVDTDFRPPRCFGDLRVVDGGDIALVHGNVSQHYNDIEAAVRFAATRNIMPVTIGGDDGVTNPVIRGTDAFGDITLIQIDAHLDWRDQRFGEADGFSSPMRRASELPHIKAIHQIGIRSVGSAEQAEWEYAKNWGAHIHLSRDIHLDGMAPVIDSLPKGGKFFVTLDVDGLDPSVMPGTVALSPGGLSWWHVVTLFEGLVEKGTIVGLNLVELAPKNDLNNLSLIGAGRLIMKLLMLQLQSPR